MKRQRAGDEVYGRYAKEVARRGTREEVVHEGEEFQTREQERQVANVQKILQKFTCNAKKEGRLG